MKYAFSFGHISVNRCMCIVSQNPWTVYLPQDCIKGRQHPFSYTMLLTSLNPTWRNQTRSNYLIQRIPSCLNQCDPVTVKTIEPWTCTCFFEDVVWFKNPEMFHSRILDCSVKWHYHISQLSVVCCCNSKNSFCCCCCRWECNRHPSSVPTLQSSLVSKDTRGTICSQSFTFRSQEPTWSVEMWDVQPKQQKRVHIMANLCVKNSILKVLPGDCNCLFKHILLAQFISIIYHIIYKNGYRWGHTYR